MRSAGCDPKKILRRGAEIIDSARLMRGKGIDDAHLSINWTDLMKHKHGFTDPVPQSMEDSLTGNGVTTLHGQARFTGPRQLEIDGVSYDADRFLVATGARPRPLDFPGHEPSSRPCSNYFNHFVETDLDLPAASAL